MYSKFGLAIDRAPLLDDGTMITIPAGAMPCAVSPTCPDGYMFRTDSSSVVTLPDGTIVAPAPPTGGIIATRNPDGSVTVGAGDTSQTTPILTAHNVLTDLLANLGSPMVFLKAHPYYALAGAGALYLLLKKK